MVTLQPLVGSCWNVAAESREPVSRRGFNPSWGPAGTPSSDWYPRHRGGASTPRGVLLEPQRCDTLARSSDRFNPSWGPAGTRSRHPCRRRSSTLQPLVGSCWNPPFSPCATNVVVLQPLVGSCWNPADREHCAPSALASTPRGVLLEPAVLLASERFICRFNPSWGPAGTELPCQCHDDGCPLQPLVGSCWNPVGSRTLIAHPPLQPLVGSCWNC